MILLVGGLILLTSLMVTAILRLPKKPAWLVSIYILSYANIVLAGEIANTLGAINQKWVFIGLHTLFASVAGIFWWKTGKPSLVGTFTGWRFPEKPIALLKRQPALVLLGLGVFLALSYGIALNLKIPPNNNDSLAIHLARVGYWLQNGSIYPWPTYTIEQIYYPINTQLQFLWLILFTNGDHLVGFSQWIAILPTMAAIFGLSRLLGWSRSQSTWVALLYMSYPVVLLQSTTTQNDLVTAALFCATLYFFLYGLQHGNKGMLILSAASFGLGLGTKQLFYFLIPGFAILVLIQGWKMRKGIFRGLLQWGGYSLVAIILFAAYMNVINWVYSANPFGPGERISYITGLNDISHTGKSLLYNIPRWIYQSIDFSGLPDPLDGYLQKSKAYPARFLQDITGFEIEGTHYAFPGHTFSFFEKNLNQEDHAWYGPISVFILFPAVIIQFIAGIRKRETLRVGLILMLPIYLLCHTILLPNWNPYEGRYFLCVVAVNTPMIAGFFSPRPVNRILQYLVLGLSLLVMTVTLLTNPAKPAAGEVAKFYDIDIWTANRTTLITLQARSYYDLVESIETLVPADATMGIYNEYGRIPEYAFFGKQMTRRLVPIYPLQSIDDPNWMNDNGIQYILLLEWEWDSYRPAAKDTLELIGQGVDWKLYVR